MAANAEMDRLLQTLMTRVPGVSEGAMHLELFNAVVTHQRQTNCWQYESSVPLVVGEVDYPIFPPAGTVMVRVLQSQYNNAPYATERFRVDYPTQITLVNAPTSMGDESPLKVLMAICLAAEQVEEDPSDWALDTWMFERFFDDWLHGVLASLYAHPAKPYSNIKLAEYHARKFRAAIASARGEAVEGYGFGGQRWRFPKFA